MTALAWLKSAGALIKKHWLAFGALLVALIGFLFGFEVKKKPVIISGVDPVKDQAEKATQQAVQVAQEQHDVVVQQAEQQAAQQDASVVQQEETKTTSIEKSSDATDETNQYLQQVSQEIGGKGPSGGSSP